ncbi:hypothetical protein PGB90_002207 [Kerria lacca]
MRRKNGYEEVSFGLPDIDDIMEVTSDHFIRKMYVKSVSKRELFIFEGSGYVLPANTSANIFIYNLHRQEKYFSNPNEFIPERFENMDKSYQYTYIPFSVGVRNCIGQIFSLIEVKIAVSMIMLKYRLLPVIKTKKIRLEIDGNTDDWTDRSGNMRKNSSHKGTSVKVDNNKITIYRSGYQIWDDDEIVTLIQGEVTEVDEKDTGISNEDNGLTPSKAFFAAENLVQYYEKQPESEPTHLLLLKRIRNIDAHKRISNLIQIKISNYFSTE